MPKPFLTPPETPGGVEKRVIEIPSSKEWLGIFNSALLETIYAYNYTQIEDTDLTPEEAAGIAFNIVKQYLNPEGCPQCTRPGGGKIIRIGANGDFEELGDDGEWHEPTGDYTIPAVPAREGGTPIDQKCLAAANAAHVLELLYEQLADDWSDGVSTAEAITNLVLAIGAIIAAPFGLLGEAVIAIAGLVFQVLYETIEFVGADLWDENFTEALKCILFGCASNDEGVVTFNLDCVNNELAAQTNPFDLTASQIRLFGQLQYIFGIIGASGLNSAGATTAITDDNCDGCNPAWCYTWDFTASDGGWEARSDIGVTVGHYESGRGWVSDQHNDSCSNHGYTYLFFVPGTTIDRINQVLIETSTVSLSAHFFDQNDGTTILERTSVPIDGETHEAAVMAVECNRIDIAFNMCDVETGGYEVRSITLRGTGENPFGTDNCE